MPRHRVTTKGDNVPMHAETFDALRERYGISSHLLQNLSEHGYKRPTGIQSYGVPILMEVRPALHAHFLPRSPYAAPILTARQRRDLAAISPTGTGKTLSYLLPIMAALGAPGASSKADAGAGVRAVVLAPTRELAHQIHNECLKLAQGRKWRVVLFSKATAATLADKNVRDKIGGCVQLERVRTDAYGSVQTSSSARP